MNPASPEFYCDVFDQLERHGVRYVVIGGVAVVLHGHVRPIFDLDIVIDPAPEEADRALQALLQAGFVASTPLPLTMVSVLRMVDGSQREINVFVRYHLPFDDLLAGSASVRLGNSLTRVVSLDHLLWFKRLTARPHDLQDIEGLLALEMGSAKQD